jgi:hypothetical protein
LFYHKTFPGQAVINWLVIWLLQRDEELDVIQHSLLSLIYPIVKLPTRFIYYITEKRLLLWLVLAGNAFLFSTLIFVYILYDLGTYNPWCSDIVLVKFEKIKCWQHLLTYPSL